MEGDFETGNTEELSPDAGIRVKVRVVVGYDVVSGGRDVDHQMLGGPVRARRFRLEATTRPPNCVFPT
jgi:hypothetical protein